MSSEEKPQNDGLKGFLGGLIKNRIDNIGDSVKQSVADVQKNIDATIRSGIGLINDENTSHLKTEFDGEAPIYETVASNEGKNARVRLWSDRLEWEKGRGISSAKVLTGLVTGGFSALVTGIRGGKEGFETLPLSALTGISISKSGLTTQIVSVQTASGSIDFEVSRYNAADFRTAVLTQMQRNASAPTKVELVNPASPAEQSQMGFAEKLQKLAELRDLGVITTDEFEQKKTQILGEI